MSFRTVVITNYAKLSYKDGYLIVRSDEAKMIHLSEIGILLVDSTMVSITTYLLCEMIKQKIKVIFCDEYRNPISELIPYYGSHNSSKRITNQIKWDEELKGNIWAWIVKQKILNQAIVLNEYDLARAEMLLEYAKQVEFDDLTNREGHAAKVYFNTLFGNGFSRDQLNTTNAALNYGYALLLSSFNKELAVRGYLTQLGLHHKNEFNPFNLSCDLMEPFRPLIDSFVVKNQQETFDTEFKIALLRLLDEKVEYLGCNYKIRTAIEAFVHNITDVLDRKSEFKCYCHLAMSAN